MTDDPKAITRCIMDSLATGYARTIADAERLAHRATDVVHIVGGGSQNRLLCQLTADATGKRVIAGPGSHRPGERPDPSTCGGRRYGRTV